jgi:hypothetical protein
MITIIHFFVFACCMIGLVFGGVAGHAHFGWWGILFAVPGAYLGLLLGHGKIEQTGWGIFLGSWTCLDEN